MACNHAIHNLRFVVRALLAESAATGMQNPLETIPDVDTPTTYRCNNDFNLYTSNTHNYMPISVRT